MALLLLRAAFAGVRGWFLRVSIFLPLNPVTEKILGLPGATNIFLDFGKIAYQFLDGSVFLKGLCRKSTVFEFLAFSVD